MVFKMVEKFNADYIRELCIKYELYTVGTNEDYTNMLQKYDGQDLTAEKLEFLADDIFHNSTTGHDIRDIMGLVLREGILRYID